MNKKELIDSIAERTAVKKITIQEVLDGFMDCVSEALAKGDSVKLVGFCSFETATSKARQGHNPKTGEIIDIPETTKAKIRPGVLLHEAAAKSA